MLDSIKRWARGFASKGNAWSTLTNAAYVAVAVSVAHTDGPAGWGFIAAMAFLTVGSSLYHAGVPRANHLDVMGIYAVGIAVWLVTILGPTVPAAVAIVALAVPGAYLLRIEQLDVRMELKVGALFGVLYATAFLFHGFNPHLVASVVVMVAALLVRARAHAVWHVLSAVGLGSLWAGVTL